MTCMTSPAQADPSMRHWASESAEGMAVQEASGKEIAGTGGVDDVGHFGGRFAHAVIALHGESTARPH